MLNSFKNNFYIIIIIKYKLKFLKYNTLNSPILNKDKLN